MILSGVLTTQIQWHNNLMLFTNIVGNFGGPH